MDTNRDVVEIMRNKVAYLFKTNDPDIWKSVPSIRIDNTWIPVEIPDDSGNFIVNPIIENSSEVDQDAVNSAINEVMDVSYDSVKDYYLYVAKEILNSDPQSLRILNNKLTEKNYTKDDLVKAVRALITNNYYEAPMDLVDILSEIEAKDSRIVFNKDNVDLESNAEPYSGNEYDRDIETFRADESEDTSSDSDNHIDIIREKINKRVDTIMRDLAQKIIRYEDKNNMTLSENQRLQQIIKYLNKNDIAGEGTNEDRKAEIISNASLVLDKYYAINKHNSENKISLLISYDDIMKFGFSSKFGEGLDILSPGDEKEFVDPKSNKTIQVTKSTSNDGDDNYIISIDGEQKAVTGENPELQDIIPVEES